MLTLIRFILCLGSLCLLYPLIFDGESRRVRKEIKELDIKRDAADRNAQVEFNTAVNNMNHTIEKVKFETMVQHAKKLGDI